jgi:hypothetical protein
MALPHPCLRYKVGSGQRSNTMTTAVSAAMGDSLENTEIVQARGWGVQWRLTADGLDAQITKTLWRQHRYGNFTTFVRPEPDV